MSTFIDQIRKGNDIWKINDARIPSLTGQAGKVLGTDGVNLNWVSGGGGGGGDLPPMTGNAGKVLGTDGNTASWVDQRVVKVDGKAAIPNEGEIDTDVIFDTDLSISEVNSIISNNITDFSMGIYPILFSYSYLIGIYPDGENNYVIYIATDDDSITLFNTEEYPETGWNPEFSGSIHITGTLVSEYEGATIGSQNSLITDLCYVVGPEYKIKQDDGTTKNLVCDVTVNGENIVRNNKVDLTIGQPILQYDGHNYGDSVPNTGLGCKFKFNKGMSLPDVNTLLASVFDEGKSMYTLVVTAEGDCYVQKESDGYIIYTDNEHWVYRNYTGAESIGWRSDFDGIVDYTGRTLLNLNNAGSNNDKIVDLFYIAEDVPYTYHIIAPDDEDKEIVESKPIIGSAYKLNDATKIAAGLIKDTTEIIKPDTTGYNTLFKLIDNTQLTTVQVQGQSYGSVSVTLSTTINTSDKLYSGMYIGTTNTNPEIYFSKLKHDTDMWYVGEFDTYLNKPVFTNYPLCIVVRPTGATLYTELPGTYYISWIQYRPCFSYSGNIYGYYSPTIINSEKALKSSVTVDFEIFVKTIKFDTVEPIAPLYYVRSSDFSDRIASFVYVTDDIILTYATSLPLPNNFMFIPAGIYWTIEGIASGMKWLSIIDDTVYKIGPDYLDIEVNNPNIINSAKSFNDLDNIAIGWDEPAQLTINWNGSTIGKTPISAGTNTAYYLVSTDYSKFSSAVILNGVIQSNYSQVEFIIDNNVLFGLAEASDKYRAFLNEDYMFAIIVTYEDNVTFGSTIFPTAGVYYTKSGTEDIYTWRFIKSAINNTAIKHKIPSDYLPIPECTTSTAGTYKLQCVVDASGNKTYSWVTA